MSSHMRLTQDELMDLKARIAGKRSLADIRDHPAERGNGKPAQKYGNTGVHGLGTKGFAKHYGFTEADLLAETMERIG